ncbi:hypothetical protein OBV_19580 [Oscillibacter valericigenes Sjm18-20]|nr:hypothetical protein OBV_19580 [Oscillibacter valericigenes Sjm18-20]
MEQLRTLSDEICEAHGLEILKPYQKPAMKPMGAGEYRSAVRSGSFKSQLMNAIDTALEKSRTKAEFAVCMEEMGYGVKWMPHHKYIIYKAPTGQRCRDNKLRDEKYLKERMEQRFAQFKRTQGLEQAAGDTTEADHALSAAGQRHSDRGMGCHAEQPNGAAGADGSAGTVYLDSADHTGNRESHPGLLSGDIRQSGRHAVSGDQRPAQEDFTDSERQDRQVTGQLEMAAATGLQGADGATGAPGCAAVEAQNQVDSHGCSPRQCSIPC